MRHDLKTWPEVFALTASECKTHEYRKNDRNFLVHDVLNLREWCPDDKEYTGREINCLVTYISRGPEWGIPEGFCVMSVKLLSSTCDPI